MKYGLDSAYPSADPTHLKRMGWEFVCGYLGPEGGTPHIWTPAEWAAQRDAGLQLAPIWVAPYGTPSYDQGVAHGNSAIATLQALGMSGWVMLDVENGAVDPDFIKGFASACHAGSCSVALYGSATTLLQAPDIDAWWLADWIQSGVPLHRPPLDWSMWQYATGPQFDYNVARDDFAFATLG